MRSTEKMKAYKRPLHIVSAQLAELGLTFGQKAVEGKSNEIPAVRELLKELDVRGCVVVADALNCQEETAKEILKGGADYLLCVKGNQKNTRQPIEEYLRDESHKAEINTMTREEKNRGRQEKRTAYATTNVAWFPGKKWPELACVGAIHREFEYGNKKTDEWHYYISSRKLTAEELLHRVRMEWSVESMHWILDVQFDEDNCRVEDNHVQRNLNILRKLAINLVKLFKEKEFWSSFRNTLIISIVKLLLNTFVAVIISIFLNEMTSMICKKFIQTVIYLPHFMSYAVVAAIFTLFLSTSSTGFVNETLKSMGIITKSIDFLHSKAMWRPIFYLINLWKETGWGTVIFFATLSGINTEQYEAASIDGATRLQRIRYITFPALSNTIIIVLILNLAKVLNIFEPVFVLYNSRVLEVSDVISTYIYRKTFLTAIPDYGYTTAVGLFKSLVGCVLMLASDIASKKVRGRGII